MELGRFHACCDMTFLRNEGNMQVIILGPGDIGMAHKIDEYIDIDSIYKTQRIYKKVATKWLTRDSSKLVIKINSIGKMV